MVRAFDFSCWATIFRTLRPSRIGTNLNRLWLDWNDIAHDALHRSIVGQQCARSSHLTGFAVIAFNDWRRSNCGRSRLQIAGAVSWDLLLS
jgi:hypothetical protein